MMKLKDGFILRNVAGQNVVVPSGDDLNLNLMITLNDTGAFLWSRLEQQVGKEELVAALLKEYDVDKADSEKAVESFVDKLNEYGFLA